MYKKIKNTVISPAIWARLGFLRKLFYRLAGKLRASVASGALGKRRLKISLASRRSAHKSRLWNQKDISILKPCNKYKALKYRPLKKFWIEPKIWFRLRYTEKKKYKYRHKEHMIRHLRTWAKLELKRKRKLGIKGVGLKLKILRYYVKSRVGGNKNYLLTAPLFRIARQNIIFFKPTRIAGKKYKWRDVAGSDKKKINRLPKQARWYLASPNYFFFRNFIREDKAISAYTRHYLKTPPMMATTHKIHKRVGNKKRGFGYLKYLLFLRYRWVYRPKLGQFRLFKKFFKRTFKRYRKINKNRLFQTKFRQHLSKLTGYDERALFKLWTPIRRNYLQYWGQQTSAVQQFSQSILLMPEVLITFLGLSPSRAASRYIIKSGVVSVNGLTAGPFSSLIPGDMIQINILPWRASKTIFNHQKWSYKLPDQRLGFIEADYSSMMFVLLRRPRSYELIAPSFLAERWLRYYVRHFPIRARKFKAALGNWKVYKKLPKR